MQHEDAIVFQSSDKRKAKIQYNINAETITGTYSGQNDTEYIKIFLNFTHTQKARLKSSYEYVVPR